MTEYRPCTVRFVDEQGTEGIYRYKPEDWPSICDRAIKRLGLKPDQDEPLRYARALKIAREK